MARRSLAWRDRDCSYPTVQWYIELFRNVFGIQRPGNLHNGRLKRLGKGGLEIPGSGRKKREGARQTGESKGSKR